MTDGTTTRRQLFKAAEHREGSSTGLGIIRYDVITGQTIQVLSLYYDSRLSNRDMFTEICKIILGEIAAEEQALIEYAGGRYKNHWKDHHKPRLLIVGKRYIEHRFGEVKALATDATERKNSIITDI